jgi:hypothetical protein
MSKSQISTANAPSPLRETRYSLHELLRDVADERMTGTLGAEKLHQSEINKSFNAEPRAKRRPRP